MTQGADVLELFPPLVGGGGVGGWGVRGWVIGGGGIQKPQSDFEASGSGYETVRWKQMGQPSHLQAEPFDRNQPPDSGPAGDSDSKLLSLVLGPDRAASVTGRAHGRQLPE